MSDPELSVLLPYRDAAATLDGAIASVLQERNVRLELIAVDDGSTDDGPQRAAAWAVRDARVVVAHVPALGIAGALNAALRTARAPLLGRMDADDISLPGRFAAQLSRFAGDSRLAVVGCQVEAFPHAGEGMRRYVAWQNSLLEAADHARQIFVESPLCHPSVVMVRDALDAVGGYRAGCFPEDYDLWLRLHAAGYGLAKVPRLGLRWRHHEGRATLTDPRYGRERFTTLKAPHLARTLQRLGRPLVVWGAGKTGKRLLRALEPHGVRATRFIDIDPRKIGRSARGAPVESPDGLHEPRQQSVLVAVGARGARDEIRRHLGERGFREGRDFLCAS